MNEFPNVLSWIEGEIWAIEPAYARRALSVLQSRIANGPAPRQAAVPSDRTRSASGVRSSISVLSLGGVLSQRLSAMQELCGGATSLDQFQRSFATAIHDPQVRAVVLNIDSPGGSVYGVTETFATIYKARGTKPIIAQVNSLAASAAFWIASAADEIVMTPSGEIGSVGVFCGHLDASRAIDKEGVTPTFVSAGKYKTEGNSLQPLGAEAAAAIQQSVDRYYSMFIGDLARGRGTTPSRVLSDFGEGRTVGAAQAVRSAMADRIATLPETLSRLIRGRSSPAGAAASMDAYRRARHQRRMLSV